MTGPLALITWFRTQLSVAHGLLCASTLNFVVITTLEIIGGEVVKSL